MGMGLAVAPFRGGRDMRHRIYGILLLAGLGQTAGAQGAEPVFGGEVALGYGFKPEFVEADGDGKYAMGQLTASARFESFSLALEEAVKTVEHPEKETTAEDPVLRFASPGH